MREIFLEIFRCCIEQRLVDGKEMAADGSYISAEVSRNSWIDVEIEVEQSMLSYLDVLDQELASQPGFKKLPSHTVTKKNYNKHNRPRMRLYPPWEQTRCGIPYGNNSRL